MLRRRLLFVVQRLFFARTRVDAHGGQEQTVQQLLCHDAERNPQVDLASCRRLGVRSILVSPLRHYRRTLGVFEVLSSSPGAFDQSDVATMQLLSSMMVAAISRISSLHRAQSTRLAG